MDVVVLVDRCDDRRRTGRVRARRPRGGSCPRRCRACARCGRSSCDASGSQSPVPIAICASRLVLFGRQRDADEAAAPATDHDDRAILALLGVLLERHPRPHDLARIGVAVDARRVLDGDDPFGRELPCRPCATRGLATAVDRARCALSVAFFPVVVAVTRPFRSMSFNTSSRPPDDWPDEPDGRSGSYSGRSCSESVRSPSDSSRRPPSPCFVSLSK